MLNYCALCQFQLWFLCLILLYSSSMQKIDILYYEQLDHLFLFCMKKIFTTGSFIYIFVTSFPFPPFCCFFWLKHKTQSITASFIVLWVISSGCSDFLKHQSNSFPWAFRTTLWPFYPCNLPSGMCQWETKPQQEKIQFG